MAKLTNIGFLIPVRQLPPSEAGVKRAALDKKIRFYSSGAGGFQVGDVMGKWVELQAQIISITLLRQGHGGKVAITTSSKNNR